MYCKRTEKASGRRHLGPIQIIERETIRETIKVVYRFSFRLSLSFLVYKSSHSFLVSFLVQFFSFIVSPIQIIMLAQTRNEKPYEKRMKFIVGSEPTRKFRSELFQPLKLIVFTPNFVHKYFEHFSIEWNKLLSCHIKYFIAILLSMGVFSPLTILISNILH